LKKTFFFALTSLMFLSSILFPNESIAVQSEPNVSYTPLSSQIEKGKNGGFSKSLEAFKEIAKEITGKEAEEMYNQTVKGLENNKFDTYKDKITVSNIDGFKVFKLEEYDLLLVQIDVESDGVHGFSVIYDNTKKVVEYSEVLITKISDTKANVKSLRNGEIVVDKDYIPSVDRDQKLGTAAKKHKSFWSAMNYCWDNLAPIPDWIQDGLNLACAAFCLSGAAPVCLGCLTTAGVGYSFEIGYCSAYALRNS